MSVICKHETEGVTAYRFRSVALPSLGFRTASPQNIGVQLRVVLVSVICKHEAEGVSAEVYICVHSIIRVEGCRTNRVGTRRTAAVPRAEILFVRPPYE